MWVLLNVSRLRLRRKETSASHEVGVGSVRLIRVSFNSSRLSTSPQSKTTVHTVYGSRDLPLVSVHYLMLGISGVFSDSCVAVRVSAFVV